MKKRLFNLLSVWIFCIAAAGGQNRFSVTISQPGTLQSQVQRLETDRVEGLTIQGTLNGTDLAFLNEAVGIMASVTYLNLSDATFLPDETTPYAVSVNAPEAGMGTTYVTTFYYSDKPRIEPARSSPTTVRKNSYCNDLSNLFAKNTSLREVHWPRSVSTVGTSAFSGCTALAEVALPTTLTTVGASAFYGCSQLRSVALPASVRTVDASAFAYSGLNGTLRLDHIAEIGAGAFCNTRVKQATFGSALRHLGADAFSSCDSLTAVTFTAPLDSLPRNAFQHCRLLSDVTLPKGLVYIGPSAFYNCSKLSQLALPATLEEVGNKAFESTPFDRNLPVEEGVCYIGRTAYRLQLAAGQRSVTVKAGTVTLCGQLFYGTQLDEILLPASVRVIGEECFYLCAVPALTLPEGLERIEGGTFASCQNLATLTLPEGLKYVGSSAFYNCTALWQLRYNAVDAELEESAMQGVKGISRIVLGPRVRRIPQALFYNNQKVTEVALPASLEEIAPNAFYRCSALATVTGGENLQRIGAQAFNECSMLGRIALGDRLETLEPGTFYQCSRLEEVTLGQNLKTIGDQAFYACYALKKVTLGEHLDSIGNDAFSQCEALQGTVSGPNLRAIGSGAFRGCKSLTAVTLGDRLETLGNQAFMQCTALASVRLGRNLQTLADATFSGCTALTEVSLPDSLRTIGVSAFYGCPLTEIRLPLGLEEVGQYAFYNTALRSLSFPEGVRAIGKYAFNNCPQLAEIYLPSTLRTAYDMDFGPALRQLVCARVPVPEWNMKFNASSVAQGTLTIRVPLASVSYYKEAWSAAAPVIWAINEITTTTGSMIASFADCLDANYPLNGTTIGGLYFSLHEADAFEAAEGSLTVRSAMSVEELKGVVGLQPGKSDLNFRFDGLVLELARGEGTVELDCRTEGNRKVAVMVGSGEPVLHTRTNRGTIVVPYAVTEPTLVYISVTADETTPQARSGTARTTDTDCVRFYAVAVNHGPLVGIHDSLTDEAAPAEIRAYYTPEGRRVTRPASPGLYIVHYADGRTAKVWIAQP